MSLCGYLGQVERGASDSQVVEDCLVSPASIFRHSFLLWLVFRDALVTKQRMSGWSYTGQILSILL